MIDIAIKHFICDKCINLFFDHLLLNFNIGPTTTRIDISSGEALKMIKNNPNLETTWGCKAYWAVYKEKKRETWEEYASFTTVNWDVRHRY